MTKPLKDKSDPVPEVKKRGRKKTEPTAKGIGLFDHIKHIRSIQDPDYFKSLTDLDKKSFNHFMILKAISMNSALLDDVSTLFKYFDKIPSPQFYQLLIGLIPPDKKFYPWVKSKTKSHNDELLELVARYFEISKKEAAEYVAILSSSEKGNKQLKELCHSYGLSDKDVESLMKGNEEES